jgi:hypothetical protein
MFLSGHTGFAVTGSPADAVIASGTGARDEEDRFCIEKGERSCVH